jgi:hypothetical protein
LMDTAAFIFYVIRGRNIFSCQDSLNLAPKLWKSRAYLLC